MTKRTEQKDLFLAALRGDAKAQRTCTKAGKPCGGRCIPKHWNCRIKGEGDTPPTRGNKVQLSAEQKEKIAKVRRSRRIRAVGAVAAIAGGAAAARCQLASLHARAPLICCEPVLCRWKRRLSPWHPTPPASSATSPSRPCSPAS